MTTTRNPLLTITLAGCGALAGLLVFALAGLIATESGLLSSFDPIGVDDERPTPGWTERAAEWSFPVFLVAGAALGPRVGRWLLEPSAAAVERDG